MKQLKIERYYVHPSVIFEDGKCFCECCGTELPLGSVETVLPCSVSAKIPFHRRVEIDVMCCSARVLVDGHILRGLTDKEAEKLEQLAVRDVDDVGGWINMSGIYPPSDRLVKYALKLFGKERIKAASMRKT